MLLNMRRRLTGMRKTGLAAVAIVLLFMGWMSLREQESIPAGKVVSRNLLHSGSILPGWGDILSLGLPGFTGGAASQYALIREEGSAYSALRGAVLSVTGIDVRNARTLMLSELPHLATIGDMTAPSIETILPVLPKLGWGTGNVPGNPLVGIYHTHTSESFIPDSGVAHSPGGQRGQIVAVGEALASRLARQGVAAVQSTNIHDHPSFMKAYGPSEETARKMLADNPSLQILFDIHRDAEKRENCTVAVGGKTYARISIIVGMGQQDLQQPYWRQNHAFAKELDARLNQACPGLTRGIQLVEWRYNQHLLPRALLLEVGCHENNSEEAVRSMEILGNVVAAMLREQ